MNRSSRTYEIISKGPPFMSWEFQKQRRKRLVKKKYPQEIMMANSPNVVIQIYRFKNFCELLTGSTQRKPHSDISCTEYEQPDSKGYVLRGSISRTLRKTD